MRKPKSAEIGLRLLQYEPASNPRKRQLSWSRRSPHNQLCDRRQKQITRNVVERISI